MSSTRRQRIDPRSDHGAGGIGSILALLMALIATSVVAGLIGAGLFMPLVGATGATATAGVGAFDALPSTFTSSPLAQQSRILASDGSVLATFYDENRLVVPLAQVAPIMRTAQIAIEDNRFYQHGGVDPRGVLRAAVNNASSSSTQGASTLTQQFIKLTLQENAIYSGDPAAARAATAQTLSRKVQEMKYAIALERVKSKDQILEGYLNIAYYGDGAYGIETAARHYFSTTAAKLTLPQAALLAGVVQQPGAFDPRQHPQAAQARRDVVLTRMLETGKITKAQHDAAVKTKLVLKIKAAENGCDSSYAPFFCNYVYAEILNNKAFGETQSARRQLVFRGGLTIRTTLDPKKQAEAVKAIADKVAPVNKSKVAAAMSVVEPGSGKVLAMAQSQAFGRDTKKGQTTINYNVDQLYGGASGFQTGSTFKAFTLAAALEQGRPLNSTLRAPKGGSPFYKSDFKPGSCDNSLRAAVYKPFNSEGNEQGTYNLLKFTADSVNTAFVQLEADVGICAVKDVAENLGVHLAKPTTIGQPGGKASTSVRPYESLTLGVEQIAPLTMAAAYASFAADGTFCEPISITAVTTLGGKALKVPVPSCTQAIPQDVARGVTKALQGVITSGTAAGVDKIGRPAAGKTGTTDTSTDLWFIGYTPQLSGAVWLGHPAGTQPMNNGVDTGKSYYPGQLFGATVSAPIWSAFMSAASDGMPVQDFTAPSAKMLYGDRVSVPDVTGQSVSSATADLQAAGFTVSVGGATPSSVAKGQVAGTNPGGGSTLNLGSSVTIYPSSGPAPGGGPTIPGATPLPNTSPSTAPSAPPTTGGGGNGGGGNGGGGGNTKPPKR